MTTIVRSATIVGLKAVPVTVEVQIESTTLPAFDIVGIPEIAVRETRVRVKSAIRNCGFPMPKGRIVVAVSPTVTHGAQTLYLPIAVAILVAAGTMPATLVTLVGELSLPGRLRPVSGVLPMALLAESEGAAICVPPDNAQEARAGCATVYAPGALSDWVDFQADRSRLAPVAPRDITGPAVEDADFKDISGQLIARRAMEIAAAGRHNVLFYGEPGAGRTMLARRLPTIMPPMTDEERMNTTIVYSVAGLLPPGAGLLSRRPFRAPHHTASEAALVGGGTHLRPGEITLAHNGVLFLDELPEFRRSVVETLVSAYKAGTMVHRTKKERVEFPAKPLLVGSMNPCPCGYLGSKLRPCRCEDDMIRRYRARVSDFVNLFDLFVHVPAISYADLRGAGGEPSADIQKRVVESRAQECGATLDAVGERLRERCAERMALTVDQQQKAIAVAKTIAKLAGSTTIRPEHLAEALSYRGHDILSPPLREDQESLAL